MPCRKRVEAVGHFVDDVAFPGDEPACVGEQGLAGVGSGDVGGEYPGSAFLQFGG